MKKIFLVLMLLPAILFAQKGVQFEHGLTWKDIQAKAKAENKYIFMDAFTTWCGPCKYMTSTIFPQEAVGSFFNKNYINVKFQLDTTAKDNDEIKKLYADAHFIMTNYKVNVFPTYLFFDPNGKLVHRAIGSSEADKFITKGQQALNPETQYYTILEKYKAGNKDAAFLRKAALSAQEAYDNTNASLLSKEYLSTQKDLSTKENIEFIDKFTNSSKDIGFAFIEENGAKYDAVKGAGAANKKLTAIIGREVILPVLYNKSQTAPDWQNLTDRLNNQYPKQAAEVVSQGKVMYYQMKKDWNGFQKEIQNYMKNYGANADAMALNNYAWTVFENCKDLTCVADALEWSKRSFKDNQNPTFMDTYANLLYKLGKNDEAIKWEEKAIALVSEAEKKSYQETLDKMKKGEKTWQD